MHRRNARLVQCESTLRLPGNKAPRGRASKRRGWERAQLTRPSLPGTRALKLPEKITNLQTDPAPISGEREAQKYENVLSRASLGTHGCMECS